MLSRSNLHEGDDSSRLHDPPRRPVVLILTRTLDDAFVVADESGSSMARNEMQVAVSVAFHGEVFPLPVALWIKDATRRRGDLQVSPTVLRLDGNSVAVHKTQDRSLVDVAVVNETTCFS